MNNKRQAEKTGLTPETKRLDSNQSPQNTGTIQRTSYSDAVKEIALVTEEEVAESFARRFNIDQDNRSHTSVASSVNMRYSFKAKTDGNNRTKITVDVTTIDGRLLKDHLTDTEMAMVYVKMGLKRANLNGISQGFSTHPVYSYRLKREINITKDIPNPDGAITRTSVGPDGLEIEQTIAYSTRDVPRVHIASAMPKINTQKTIRWVRLENTQYSIDEEEMKTWLNRYGTVETSIGEDPRHLDPIPKVLVDSEDRNEKDSDDSSDEFGDLGNGNFKAKVNLKTQIPQYLPMYGQKVKIYYPGIQKMCVKCYSGGHIKRDCTNQKREWVDYIMQYMNENPEIPDEEYGKWADIAKKEYKIKGYRGIKPDVASATKWVGNNEPVTQSPVHSVPEMRQSQIDEVSAALNTIREKENRLKQMKEAQAREEEELEKLKSVSEAEEKSVVISTQDENITEEELATNVAPTVQKNDKPKKGRPRKKT